MKTSGKFGRGTVRLFVLASALLAAPGLLSAEEAKETFRTWTDAGGAKLEAEYISSTADTVTLRGKNLKNMKVPLDKLSEADQTFVKDRQKAEAEANNIKVSFKGEIAWSLSKTYMMMSWMNNQSTELWTWDEEGKKPKDKVTEFKTTYSTSSKGARFEMEGYYQTEEVTVNKNDRFVILAKLRFDKDNRPVEEKDTSIPMSIPEDAGATVKFPTVRASAR
jgi:hypothetical protein